MQFVDLDRFSDDDYDERIHRRIENVIFDSMKHEFVHHLKHSQTFMNNIIHPFDLPRVIGGKIMMEDITIISQLNVLQNALRDHLINEFQKIDILKSHGRSTNRYDGEILDRPFNAWWTFGLMNQLQRRQIFHAMCGAVNKLQLFDTTTVSKELQTEFGSEFDVKIGVTHDSFTQHLFRASETEGKDIKGMFHIEKISNRVFTIESYGVEDRNDEFCVSIDIPITLTNKSKKIVRRIQCWLLTIMGPRSLFHPIWTRSNSAQTYKIKNIPVKWFSYEAASLVGLVPRTPGEDTVGLHTAAIYMMFAYFFQGDRQHILTKIGKMYLFMDGKADYPSQFCKEWFNSMYLSLLQIRETSKMFTPAPMFVSRKGRRINIDYNAETQDIHQFKIDGFVYHFNNGTFAANDIIFSFLIRETILNVCNSFASSIILDAKFSSQVSYVSPQYLDNDV